MPESNSTCFEQLELLVGAEQAAQPNRWHLNAYESKRILVTLCPGIRATLHFFKRGGCSLLFPILSSLHSAELYKRITTPCCRHENYSKDDCCNGLHFRTGTWYNES